MPPLCLSRSYLYYSVQMSSFALSYFILTFSSSRIFFSLALSFFNIWISGWLLILTSEAPLSADRQFVCLKASSTQRSIFCVKVWACVSHSLWASFASASCLGMPALCVCVTLVVFKLRFRSPWQAPMLGSQGVCVIAISICFLCCPVTSPPQRSCSEGAASMLEKKETAHLFCTFDTGHILQQTACNICCAWFFLPFSALPNMPTHPLNRNFPCFSSTANSGIKSNLICTADLFAFVICEDFTPS